MQKPSRAFYGIIAMNTFLAAGSLLVPDKYFVTYLVSIVFLDAIYLAAVLSKSKN